jgi:phage/plasmid-like protein (TIGR03299 family)
LEIKADGKASMFYTDWQTPWHKLGVSVAEAPTGADARKLAGTDWEVGMQPVRTDAGDVIAGYKAVTRLSDGKVFAITSNRWTPFQNAEIGDFVDDLVAAGSLKRDTAGALYGGAKVWELVRVPEEITVGPGDKVYPYILVFNGHDGHTALSVLPTTVRVVCNNTLNAAIDRAAGVIPVRIYHVGKLETRLAEARRVLGISSVEIAAFSKMAEGLAARDGLPHIKQLLNRLFPEPAKDATPLAKTLYEQRKADLDETLKRQAGDGSAWAVLNGVTAYVDHRLRHAKRDEHADSRKMNSVLLGADARVKTEAAQILMSLTGIYQEIKRDREAAMVAVKAKTVQPTV